MDDLGRMVSMFLRGDYALDLDTMSIVERERKRQEEEEEKRRAVNNYSPLEKFFLGDYTTQGTRTRVGRDSGGDDAGDYIPQQVVPPDVPSGPDEMFVDQRVQPPPIPDEMFVSESVQAPPVPPEQNSWEQFVAMNPGLDFAKVAEQAGGNVPGGTFSEMPDNQFAPDHPQSDEAFFKFVEEQRLQGQLDQMLDSRSRLYDPAAAELLMQRESQRKNDAAYELRQRAEMVIADAKTKEIEALTKLANAGMTKSGKQINAQPKGSPEKRYAEFANQLQAVDLQDQAKNAERDRDVMALRHAIARGDYATADAIAQKYSGLEGQGDSVQISGTQDNSDQQINNILGIG